MRVGCPSPTCGGRGGLGDLWRSDLRGRRPGLFGRRPGLYGRRVAAAAGAIQALLGAALLSVNQSINQSINRSINQKVDQCCGSGSGQIRIIWPDPHHDGEN